MDTVIVYEILILEDYGANRTAFCALLEKSMKAVNIHEASSYEEAIHILSSVKIDFAFLDILLSSTNADDKTGIDVLKYIRAQELNVRAIMLSVVDTQQSIDECINAGASGYIRKNYNAPNVKDVMKDALLSVLTNKIFVPYPGISARNGGASADAPRLTPKERVFLYYYCQGDSFKVIASKMNIAISTARGLAANLYIKFNVHTRSKLMAMVARLDIHLPNPGLGDHHHDG